VQAKLLKQFNLLCRCAVTGCEQGTANEELRGFHAVFEALSVRQRILSYAATAPGLNIEGFK